MKHFMIFALTLCLSVANAHTQDSLRHPQLVRDTLYQYTCPCGCHYHPANNYSGLNSLRARLANRSWNGKSEPSASWNMTADGILGAEGSMSNGVSPDSTNVDKSLANNPDTGSPHYSTYADAWKKKYLTSIMGGDSPIGAPVYFFFRIATTTLTDSSQLINLDAIAELANRWHLKVRVVGAADVATGSPDGNLRLSQSRADYIVRQLQARGVPAERIQTLAEGGISTFIPVVANRQCRVELY